MAISPKETAGTAFLIMFLASGRYGVSIIMRIANKGGRMKGFAIFSISGSLFERPAIEST